MEVVRQKVEQWLEAKMKEEELFLVDVRLLPGNRLQVFIDSNGGITIDKCAEVSRFLETFLDSEKILGENYNLEISSPGIDQPFKVLKQYLKNIGKKVDVLLNNGIKKRGTLLSADENKILLEEQANKQTVQTEIFLNQIKNTKTVLTF